MQKISILNFAIGFALIFLSSSGGFFLGILSSHALNSNQALLGSWFYILLKSAHAHTNLFGFVHIMFGLTLPYSRAIGFQAAQTIGLGIGSFAMSALMCIRAYYPPEVISILSDVLSLITGVCLTIWLMSLGSHIFFLTKRLVT